MAKVANTSHLDIPNTGVDIPITILADTTVIIIVVVIITAAVGTVFIVKVGTTVMAVIIVASGFVNGAITRL